MRKKNRRLKRILILGLALVVVGASFTAAVLYLGNKTKDSRSEFFVPGSEDSTAVFGEEVYPEVFTDDGGHCQAQIFVPGDGSRIEAVITEQSGPVDCATEIDANTDAGWDIRDVGENEPYIVNTQLFEAAVRLCGFHNGGVTDENCTIVLFTPEDEL